MGTGRHFEATGFNIAGKFDSFFVFIMGFGGHVEERRSRCWTVNVSLSYLL
jgi:hypothetical protein